MHFEDFSYFSKHSIQINVGEKIMHVGLIHECKNGALKRVNKWDFPRIYGFFLNFKFVITFNYHD